MFEVGERVVCVDDAPHPDWDEVIVRAVAKQLKAGRVYTITYIGSLYRHWTDGTVEEAGLGVRLAEIDLVESDDALEATRFRPLRKLDTSESLKALKGLAADCPPILERVG